MNERRSLNKSRKRPFINYLHMEIEIARKALKATNKNLQVYILST